MTPGSPISPRCPQAPTGFSLVEMVVSLAVIGLLLGGMTSAVVLATSALPHRDGPAAATIDAADALHRLRDDLAATTELLNRTATSVTLHLPDRDGDGHPEVVTYAWSGTPGDPLTRTANGQPAADFCDTVEHFDLAYTTADLATAYPGPVATSAEVLLSSFDHSAVGDPKDISLDYNNPFAVQVTPALPAGAGPYDVTRVLLYTQANGHANSDYSVQVRPMNGSEPADLVTESVATHESDLATSYAWSETVFADAGPFANGDDFAVVLEHGSGNSAGKFYADNTATANLIRSYDGGDDWNYSNNDRMAHYAYGTYETTGDDWTLSRPVVTSVRVELVHATDGPVTHALHIPLANAPTAVDALWEADFDADPTTLDLTQDGTPDWQDDGTFDAAALADGRWEATDSLASWPEDQALDGPFTLDLWAEDTTDDADGGGVRVRFDRDGSLQAFVTAEVNLTASGQQVFVFTKDSGGATVEWVNHTRPAGASVHVKLAADPANDVVAVTIDGEVMGSFVYERLSNGSNRDTVRPFVDGTSSGVYLDHVRLAVGGTAAVTPGAYTGD